MLTHGGRRNADFQPELRKNIVTREWVIIAKGRSRRPEDYARQEQAQEEPAYDPDCPFCPGNESKTPPEVYALRERTGSGKPGAAAGGSGAAAAQATRWLVRVVPNKFAALRGDGSDRLRHVGIYSARDGYGAHEVIVESPQHNKDLWEMPRSQVEAVIECYRQRYLAYEAAESLHQVLIFRNHGIHAGTSLMHPHSQLIAGPVLPHQIHLELVGSSEYLEYLGKCVFCAIIDHESRGDERTVLQTERFLVVTAFAARYPFEMWVLPKRHSIRFADMSEEEATDFASVLRDALGRLARCLGRPSYNYAIHSAPAAEHNVRAYHWHVEIYPRMTTLGGFELGSDIYINVTSPEDAAEYLRKAAAPLA
jgi:UDPglucose--hexose-1-phosphate uridylyltransferase